MRVVLPNKSVEPWYRQGWPWFLMAFPAIAVIAGLVTLWLALSTWDGLVVDDYYQEGKTIEKTMARSLRAAELGLIAELSLRSDEVSVRLAGRPGAVLPPTVVLTFAHPTRSGMDQILLLKPRAGVFVAPVAPLAAGRWLIQLEDESRSWRLNGSANVPTDTVVRVLPVDS